MRGPFMQACRICGEVKLECDFPTQRKYGFRGDASTTTLRRDCKACVALKAKEYRRTRVSTPKPKLDLSIDKYLYSAITCRCGDAKARATKAGLDYNITPQYLYQLYVLQNGKCAITGFQLSTTKQDLNVLSLDQIEAGKGYVVGNVQWVTWAVNRAKGDCPKEYFLQMCKAVLGRCNDYPEREYS